MRVEAPGGLTDTTAPSSQAKSAGDSNGAGSPFSQALESLATGRVDSGLLSGSSTAAGASASQPDTFRTRSEQGRELRSGSPNPMLLAGLLPEQRFLPTGSQDSILRHQGYRPRATFTHRFDPGDTGNAALNSWRSLASWFSSLQTGRAEPNIWNQINLDEIRAVLLQEAKGVASLNNPNVSAQWLRDNVEFVIHDVETGQDLRSPYVDVTGTIYVKP